MLEVDLTPADMKIDVLEGEPSSIVFPVTINGAPVDVAAEFPNLVSRTRVTDDSVLESTVDIQNVNEIIATIPALVYVRGQKVYWELRDVTADKTWITAKVEVERDRV
jgi:hypothetical protein